MLISSGVSFSSNLLGGLGSDLRVFGFLGLSGFPSGEIFSVDTLLIVFTLNGELFSFGLSLSTFGLLLSLNNGLSFSAVSGEMSLFTAVVAWPRLSGGSILTGQSLAK